MSEIKIGIRVPEVAAAAAFYEGFGFTSVATVPDAHGMAVLTVMVRDGLHLVLDALVGLPFPDTERERLVQRGPRGLGFVIGIEVADLEAVFDFCVSRDLTITGPVQRQPWGEETFTCIDPFGFEWKFAVKTGFGSVEDVSRAWFPST
ncbi:MAG: VOC family protein [Oxalobacteraceae bacterium]|nr:MAG: VOC family protein [Oxalobacteraceae bacterium]